MTSYIPITKSEQLDLLDENEVIEGYNDGLKNEPEPKGNRSFSYWHGWKNGMVDGGFRSTTDEAQRQLVHDAVETGYFRK